MEKARKRRDPPGCDAEVWSHYKGCAEEEIITLPNKKVLNKKPFRKRFSFNSPTPSDLDLTALPFGDLQTPENDKLLQWALCYLKKEVIGVGSPHTSAAKLQDLQKFVNYFHYHQTEGFIKQWDRALTQGFIEKLRDNYEVSTIKRIMATLSNFTRFLERKKVIEYDDNPTRKVTLPKTEPPTPRSLMAFSEDNRTVLEGKDVYERLLEAAKSMIQEKKGKRDWPHRDVAIISTLYHTGLRVSELCNLTMSQLERDYETGGIIFRRVHCKGNKERDVYLKDKGVEHLDSYINNERGDSPGPLFMTYYKKQLTRYAVWRIIKKIADRVRLTMKDFTKIESHPHRLRHERAYNLLKAGFSESEVADELGHSGTKYVGLYIKRSDKERFKRLNKVE